MFYEEVLRKKHQFTFLFYSQVNKMDAYNEGGYVGAMC